MSEWLFHSALTTVSIHLVIDVLEPGCFFIKLAKSSLLVILMSFISYANIVFLF